MTDTIYLGKADLVELKVCVRNARDFMAIGLKVEEYGTSWYVDPIQVKIDMNGLTLICDKTCERKNVPLRDIYVASCDESVILQLDPAIDGLLQFKEYTHLIHNDE